MVVAAPVATGSVARRRASLRPGSVAVGLRSVAGFAVVLALWELIARVVLAGDHLIAPPTGIASAVADNWALYLRNTRVTLAEAAWGFWWGNLAALLLACLVAIVPIVERVVLRLSLVVYCLPLVALGPLLRVIYGHGDGPQVTLAGLAVFYTTLVPLLVGLRAVPQTWADMVHSYGRGRLAMLRVVRLRASIPYFAAGLQVAVPAAVLGALVGEFTGAERGLGVLIINTMRGLRTDELWAVASVSALVSMAGYVLAGVAGRRLAVDQPAILLAAPPSGRGRSHPARLLRSTVEIVITVLLVIALWEGSMRWFDLNRYFAKRPSDVWRYLLTDPEAAAHRTEIFDALGRTAQIAVPGYVLGLVVGAVLASLFDLSSSIRRTVTPFAVALRCVPIVAIAPLLVQAFGRDVSGTILTVAVMTFFPTLVACAQGLRQAPGQVLDFYAVYDTSHVRTLVSAQVPAMLPAFFAAARIAVPSTVLAATVAEWLATGTGMGNLMSLAAVNSRYATLWSCVVVVTAIAAVAYGAMAIIERAVLARVAPEQLSW